MLPRATHRDRVVRPRRYGPEVGASIAGNDRSRGRVDRSAAHGGPLPGPYLRARPHGRRATLLAAALGVSLFWASSRDRTHSDMMSDGAGLARSVSRLAPRSEEHTSKLQSLTNLVCRLLLEKKKK